MIGTSFRLFIFSGSVSSEVFGLVRFQGLLGWGSAFSSIPFFFLLGLHISMGPGRFLILRIGSDPVEVSGSGRTGGEPDFFAMVVHRGAMQNVEVVGPSHVEPLYGEIFVTRYGSPLGVQIWCPDVLTTYVVQVPKMVCFFEVAFENGLRFPLYPFITRVLQHFNVFPS